MVPQCRAHGGLALAPAVVAAQTKEEGPWVSLVRPIYRRCTTEKNIR